MSYGISVEKCLVCGRFQNDEKMANCNGRLVCWDCIEMGKDHWCQQCDNPYPESKVWGWLAGDGWQGTCICVHCFIADTLKAIDRPSDWIMCNSCGGVNSRDYLDNHALKVSYDYAYCESTDCDEWLPRSYPAILKDNDLLSGNPSVY